MAEKQKQQEGKVIVLKGRFKALNTNTYGLFIIFFNKGLKIVEGMTIVASHFSSLYDNDPAGSWIGFEERINILKWRGDISVNTTHDLQTLMTNTIQTDAVTEYIEAIGMKKLSKVEGNISTIVEKALADHNVVIDLEVEDTTQEAIKTAREEKARQERKEREEKVNEEQRKVVVSPKFIIEKGSVALKVSLVLGPVNGIPIYELRIGDQIMIRIEGKSEKEQYFIDLLNARSETKDIIPIPSTVKEVFLNSIGEYEILTQIGPGIYGTSVEKEQVKLKRYEPMLDGRPKDVIAKQELAPQTAVYERKPLFIWVLGGVTFILALLVAFLLFSGKF